MISVAGYALVRQYVVLPRLTASTKCCGCGDRSGGVSNATFQEVNLFSKKVCLLVVVFAMIALPVFAQQYRDFNDDGKVDFSDFLLLTAVFGTTSRNANYNVQMDLDGDGEIGFSDLLIFWGGMGFVCEPLFSPGHTYTGPNENVSVSIDLIEDGKDGNGVDDGIREFTVTGQEKRFAVEVFVKGVTTTLVGARIEFDFDETILRFASADKGEFFFVADQGKCLNYVSSAPVTLPESGFLARVEFATIGDITDRKFTIGIKEIILAESTSQASFNSVTTSDQILFKPRPRLYLDTQIESPAQNDNVLELTGKQAGDLIQLQLFVPDVAGQEIQGYTVELGLDGKPLRSISNLSGVDWTGNNLVTDISNRWNLSMLSFSALTVPSTGYMGQIDLTLAEDLTEDATVIVRAATLAIAGEIEKVDVSKARVALIAPEQPLPCPGDFDNDRMVNIADFLAFVAVFGARSGSANYNALMDLDNNGKIDIADFLAFVAVFGTTCG